MKLLHIDSSIQPTNSLSREMSAAVAKQLEQGNPELKIQYLDLEMNPVPHLTHRVFAGIIQDVNTSDYLETEIEDINSSKQVLEDFMAADIILLGVPLYNYSIPSTLRAWIDRIVVFGKTFHYAGPNQPVGLAAGKRIIVTLARGGIFSGDSPTVQHEHAETYLRSVFSLVGVNDVEFIIAEGVAISPEARETALQNALEKIHTLSI